MKSGGQDYVWTGGATAAPDAQQRPNNPPPPIVPPDVQELDTDALGNAVENVVDSLTDAVCTDTGTQDDDGNIVRVRHYSRDIDSIIDSMIIAVNQSMNPEVIGPVIWVEHPVTTGYSEEAVQRRSNRFFITKINGFVEFNVDLDRWAMGQDPNIGWDPYSKVIQLHPPYNTIGFPLSDPGVNPVFFDEKGGQIWP